MGENTGSESLIGQLKLPCGEVSENPNSFQDNWVDLFDDTGEAAGSIRLVLSRGAAGLSAATGSTDKPAVSAVIPHPEVISGSSGVHGSAPVATIEAPKPLVAQEYSTLSVDSNAIHVEGYVVPEPVSVIAQPIYQQQQVYAPPKVPTIASAGVPATSSQVSLISGFSCGVATNTSQQVFSSGFSTPQAIGSGRASLSNDPTDLRAAGVVVAPAQVSGYNANVVSAQSYASHPQIGGNPVVMGQPQSVSTPTYLGNYVAAGYPQPQYPSGYSYGGAPSTGIIGDPRSTYGPSPSTPQSYGIPQPSYNPYAPYPTPANGVPQSIYGAPQSLYNPYAPYPSPVNAAYNPAAYAGTNPGQQTYNQYTPYPTPSAPQLISPRTTALPPGWEERKTGDGKSYYVDHNTKRTVWERPV